MISDTYVSVAQINGYQCFMLAFIRELKDENVFIPTISNIAHIPNNKNYNEEQFYQSLCLFKQLCGVK